MTEYLHSYISRLAFLFFSFFSFCFSFFLLFLPTILTLSFSLSSSAFEAIHLISHWFLGGLFDTTLHLFISFISYLAFFSFSLFFSLSILYV
jgi:hypothetical protein